MKVQRQMRWLHGQWESLSLSQTTSPISTAQSSFRQVGFFLFLSFFLSFFFFMRKIVPELKSVPLFLYFVYGLMSSV